MPGGMQHGSHNHELFILQHLVNYAIRKALRVTPADVFARMSARIEQRILGKRTEDLENFLHKITTKAGLALVIPRRRFLYVISRLRSDDDLPVHDLERDRSRSFILANGTDESGFAR